MFFEDTDSLRASLIYPGGVIVMPPLLLTSAVIGGTIGAACGVPESEIETGAAIIESIAASSSPAEAIGTALASHLQAPRSTSGGVELVTDVRFQGLRVRDAISRPHGVWASANRSGQRPGAPTYASSSSLPALNPRLALAVILVVSARRADDGANLGDIVVEYESVPRRFSAWAADNRALLRREFEEARREMLEALCCNARRR